MLIGSGTQPIGNTNGNSVVVARTYLKGTLLMLGATAIVSAEGNKEHKRSVGLGKCNGVIHTRPIQTARIIIRAVRRIGIGGLVPTLC